MVRCPKCGTELSILKTVDSVITKQFICSHCDTMLDLNGKSGFLREIGLEVSIVIIIAVLVLFLNLSAAQVMMLAFIFVALYIYVKSHDLQRLFDDEYGDRKD